MKGESRRSELPQVPGLTVEREIGRGAQGTVFRALRDGQPYAVKVHHAPVHPQDAAGPSASFRREVAALARLNHPALVHIFDVGEVDSRPYLVMELAEGRPLSDLIREGPLPEAHVVGLARALAGALAEVNRWGMVHRDVKPKNILVLPSGGAKLIDFGFVTTAQSSAPEAEVAATLRYAAPEQVGSLQRPVDGRSDIYALGAVLFECLTGRPPFLASHIGELARQHAAEAPPDVRALNPAVSPQLAKVVARCLAKDPDDRFADGDALVHALSEDSGPLEASDPLEEERTELVGRRAELETLKSRWRRVCDFGTGGFVLVEGESGTGKSRLARELIREAHHVGALILRAKSSPGDAVPFGAIREAIDKHLAAIVSWPEASRREALAQVRAAAGEFTPLLKRFTPRLKAALADVEAPEHLGTQEQFLNAVATLLVRLARPSRMVLLLDDIQWMDEGSRSVIGRLSVELPAVPLLVLCTARSETDNQDAFQRFVAQNGIGSGDRLRLAPLDREAVDELVCAFLGAPRVDAALVETLYVRSEGNPFAALQFLSSMLEGGLLRPSWGHWVIERSGVEHLSLPSDVVQLIIRRLDDLDPASREHLTLAAVMGSRVSAGVVARVARCTPEQGARTIAIGRRAGLLEPTDEDTYAFVHDRIRESLLAQLDEEGLREAHRRCADALEELAGDDPQQVFSLAVHASLGDPGRNRERVFQANARAGRVAFEQFAYEESYGFLATAIRAAGESGMSLPGPLRSLFGEVCTRTARLAEALPQLQQALETSSEPLERSRIHMALARVHSAAADNDQALIDLEAAFREAGARPPRESRLAFAASVAEWGLGLAADWIGLGRASAQGKQRELLSHVSELFNFSGYLGYLRNSEALLMQPCVRSLLPAHRLGPSREAVIAYASYTMVLGVMKNRRGVDAYAARARAISEQLGDRAMVALTEFHRAIAVAFCGDLLASTELASRCASELGQWLDTGQHITLTGHLQHCLLARGLMREAWVVVERDMLPHTRRSPHLADHAFIVCGAAAALSVLGRHQEAERFYARGRSRERPPGARDVYWFTSIQYGIPYHLGRDEPDAGLEAEFARLEPYEREPGKLPHHIRIALAYKVLARIEQLARSPAHARREAVERLESAERTLARVATVPVYESYVRLARGVLHAHRGQPEQARSELHGAWDLAERLDSPLIFFEIMKQRARMLRSEGNQSVALQEAQRARDLAVAHGWASWERKWSREFDLEPRAPIDREESKAVVSSTTHPRSIRTRRHLDALLQVSLASASSSDLTSQARATLDELVRVLNAERGFLFLCVDSSDELRPVAARDASQADLDPSYHYSTSAVQRVHATGAPCIITGTEEGANSAAESHVALGLRSIIAAPLRLNDRRIGVVYLDSRLAKGLFTEDDVDILTAVANHISISLETARATRLELERQTLEKDLAVTAAVQSLLLPKRDTYETEHVRLAGYYRPAAQSGGDWWWYEARDDELVVLVGDVTGHGAGSAMVSATVASAFTTLKQGQGLQDLPATLRAINQTLWELCGSAYAMTMGAFAYRWRTRTLRLWSAAAPPVLLLHGDGSVDGLPAIGTPLSSADFELGTIERRLAPGDRLLLFTDGLAEAQSPRDRPLGLAGIRRLLIAGRDQSLAGARRILAEGLNAHAAGRAPDDDVAFVLVEAS